MLDTQASDAFIHRWQQADGSELANYQLFLTELTALLDLPPPDPAGKDNEDNAYVFERRVTFRHPDGSTSNGRIDLYRRGAFVLEAKQSGLTMQSTAWDAAMLKARAQASNYARALPAGPRGCRTDRAAIQARPHQAGGRAAGDPGRPRPDSSTGARPLRRLRSGHRGRRDALSLSAGCAAAFGGMRCRFRRDALPLSRPTGLRVMCDVVGRESEAYPAMGLSGTRIA